MNSSFIPRLPLPVDRACSSSLVKPSLEIPGWRLISRLGGGTLTDVFAATTAGMPKSEPAAYAIKTLSENAAQNPDALIALHNEALAGRQVKCPHVIPILGANLREPPHYLVMPLLRGVSLEALLQTKIRLSLPAMLWIARQVAEAIDAIQIAGWVHGDVKPSNILVSPSGHVTLIDLGFARRTLSASQPEDPHEQPFLGTLCYCAPELMISRLRGDVRSDLYSLAVVLYEMLAGTMPFESHDPGEIVRRHREELPLDVRILAPHIPAKIARLINIMLSKDPLRRVQTAAEMIQRLTALEIETFSQRSLVPIER